MTTVRAVGGPIATPGVAPAGTARPPMGLRPALSRRSTRSAGVAIGLVSAMCFGTSGTFGTALIGAGWTPAGAVLARVLVAALALTVPALLALRGRWRVLRRSAWQVTVYGLVGVAACQVCYFNAIARMPVGISIMLEYLGIVLIVLWLWVRHGQTPRPLTIGGGVAGLGGARLARRDAQPDRGRGREPHRRAVRADGGGVDGGLLLPVGGYAGDLRRDERGRRGGCRAHCRAA